MQKLLFTPIFVMLTQMFYTQIYETDSTIMSNALNDFVNKPFEKYYIINKTYDNEFWRFRYSGDIAISELSAAELKISEKSLEEMKDNTRFFKVAKLPKFKNAILVDKEAEEITRLTLSMNVTSETTEESLKQLKQERSDQLRTKFKPEELIVYAISEPFYDTDRVNCILILVVFELGTQKTYVLAYKETKNGWILTKTKLAYIEEI